MTELIALGICVLGMLGAFYLGSRKDKEHIFESNPDLTPESMDIPEEPTEKEYQKQLNSWKNDGEIVEAESKTG